MYGERQPLSKTPIIVLSEQQLRPEDVGFPGRTNLDRNGRIFFWQGGVYRAISHEMAPLYLKLLESAHATALFDAGLINTRLAPLQLEGYACVIEHERIPFVSYVTEWSAPMLRDAALLTLDISMRLDDAGLELQDAHPWNVLFRGCTPKFIDFSSIVASQESGEWRPLREFIGTFLYPLFLMSRGHADHARSLLVDQTTLRGRWLTSPDVVWRLLRKGKITQLVEFGRWCHAVRGGSRTAVLKQLRSCIVQLRVSEQQTAWSDYCDEEVDFSSFDTWMTKRKVTHDVLERCRPATVLDIGSNSGWFSKLAALKGARVVAFDADEPSIMKLYANAEARRLSVLPLAMNFRLPTPAYGLELRCAPATDRLKAEMVLALAIVHHLVFKQRARFDEIARDLAAYAGRWLLVEFIPRDDQYVAKYFTSDFDWYTADGFLAALKQHFRSVEVLPSNPEPRILILCER